MILFYLFIFFLLVLLIGCVEIFLVEDGFLAEEVFEDGETHPVLAWVLLPCGVLLTTVAVISGYWSDISVFWKSWAKSAGFSK